MSEQSGKTQPGTSGLQDLSVRISSFACGLMNGFNGGALRILRITFSISVLLSFLPAQGAECESHHQ